MAPQMLVGLHRPGNSLLHRLPVGFKVLALGAFSLTIVLVRDARASVVFLAIALLLAAIARVPLRHLWRAARTILLLAVFVAA